jgi:hypothetical protein
MPHKYAAVLERSLLGTRSGTREPRHCYPNKCRTRRSSEREPADSLGGKSNVIGGWLPSLTFALRCGVPGVCHMAAVSSATELFPRETCVRPHLTLRIDSAPLSGPNTAGHRNRRSLLIAVGVAALAIGTYAAYSTPCSAKSATPPAQPHSAFKVRRPPAQTERA